MRVISVVGFLGSGKTTTILTLARHLTSKGQRVAFLINDAGEVQIDGAVIRAGGHEVVEIFTGCLCLMRDDLYMGLSDLARIEGLEWVIIEPSGMADAARLTRLLEHFPRAIDPKLASRYRLHKRLSLVDAARYRLLMRSSPSPGTIKHSSGGYRFLEQGGHHGGKGTCQNRRRYSCAHEAGSRIGTCFG